MSKEWKHNGCNEGITTLVPGPVKHEVERTDTGERREVYVGGSQTVGEAIEKGQFTDRKYD